jgi:AcrR family transcriptional regulator
VETILRAGCSEKEACMFGKPGRPREDALRRRLEIYTAVAPLIEKAGARELTMRQAANAAHMSLGGVYHYFPSKRELVLFGLSPEALHVRCAELHQQLARVQRTGPRAQLAIFLDSLVRLVSFSRPALLAAIELGAGPTFDTIEGSMKMTLEEFINLARAVRTDLPDAEADALDRALRHTLFGAMLDRSATPKELHSELRSIAEMTLLTHLPAGGHHPVPSA